MKRDVTLTTWKHTMFEEAQSIISVMTYVLICCIGLQINQNDLMWFESVGTFPFVLSRQLFNVSGRYMMMCVKKRTHFLIIHGTSLRNIKTSKYVPSRWIPVCIKVNFISAVANERDVQEVSQIGAALYRFHCFTQAVWSSTHVPVHIVQSKGHGIHAINYKAQLGILCVIIILLVSWKI